MRILLITDTPPNKAYSGSLLTDSLCRHLTDGDIFCFAVLSKKLVNREVSSDLGISIEYHEKPVEKAITGPLVFKPLADVLNFIRELVAERILVGRLVKRIIAKVKEDNIDRIWIILQGQTTIRIAARLEKLRVSPMMVQVWDHVDWWLGNNQVDALTAKRVRKQYDYVIAHCDAFGGASFEMAEQARKSGVFSVPLVSSLGVEGRSRSLDAMGSDDPFIIGFSGQLYSEAAFDRLIDALIEREWKMSGRKVVLRILGYNLSLRIHNPCNIEYLGYRTQEDVVRILGESHLLYCPYITDERYREVAKTSFPAKLTTYLATGVPVLFYGPSYSSPYKFLERNRAAFLSASDEDADTGPGSLLESVLESSEMYAGISLNAIKAYERYLTNPIQKEAFLRFLTANGEYLQ